METAAHARFREVLGLITKLRSEGILDLELGRQGNVLVEPRRDGCDKRSFKSTPARSRQLRNVE